jgi:hypothetical protein
MAQRIQTLLIDDLDGGEADDTVVFPHNPERCWGAMRFSRSQGSN